MTVSLTFGGSSLQINSLPDSDGDKFWVSDVEGLDSAEIEYERSDKYDDGGVVNYTRVERREINIKGWAQGSGANSVWRVRKKLEDWVAYFMGRQDWLYVNPPSPGNPVQLLIQRSGRLHLPPPRGDKLQEFDCTFSAEDPRKYSQTLQQSTPGINGTATITNNGNYPTFVVATLLTTGTNPWVQNNTTANARLTLAGTIPANSIVDFSKKLTTDNAGVPREYAARPRNWWVLAPGANVISTFGTWKLEWRSAYL